MPGQLYGGLPGNIANPPVIAISQATNANPIVITTTGAHGLTTGDLVDIFGSANFGANCVNTPVTVSDATHFTIPINGTTFVNGGATGNVFPLGYTQNIATIPADGDAHAMATFVPGYQAALDRSAFQRANTGNYKELAPSASGFNDVGSAVYTELSWNIASQAWTAGTFYQPANVNTPSQIAIPNVATIDLVELTLDANVVVTFTTTLVFAFFYTYTAGTIANTKVAYSDTQIGNQSGAQVNTKLSMRGIFGGGIAPLTATAPQTVGTLTVSVQVTSLTSGTFAVPFPGSTLFFARQKRLVSVQQ